MTLTVADEVDNFKNQKRMNRFPTERVVAYTMLAIGSTLVASSLVYGSSLSATTGLVIVFWGAMLLYVAPSKTVSLELLNATAGSNMVNIERLLKESKIMGTGVYLPPVYLDEFGSSLVVIPKETSNRLSSSREVDTGRLYSSNLDGLFLTPPGFTLSKLFEKELGISFTDMNLDILKKKLPELLVEDMGIAENTEIKLQGNIVTIETTNNIFSKLCEETRKLERTHAAVGCVFSSALACAITKASGKPVVIKEELVNEEEISRIEFWTLEKV